LTSLNELTKKQQKKQGDSPRMKAIGYLVLVGAVLVSLVFVLALRPTSLGVTVAFSAWLSLPYIILAPVLVFTERKRASMNASVFVTVVVAGAGLLFLTDIIYLHPDAQGGIAILFTPIYQGIGMGVLLPLSHWLSGKFSA
jgi:multidrug transporter EmrE-like cation transporter